MVRGVAEMQVCGPIIKRRVSLQQCCNILFASNKVRELAASFASQTVRTDYKKNV